MSPRPGACSPWVNGTDVAALPRVAQAIAKNQSGQSGATFPAFDDDTITAICAESATMATDILYELSGSQFTGECGPVTIRPVARPKNVDARAFLADGGAWGFGAAWGSTSWYGLGEGNVVTHFGDSAPPELPLGVFPVRTVLQVKIDGVVIPGPYDPATQTGEWELRDFKTLVRIRPTASSVPTERWGWPVNQIGDLPDTQEGTFSVTYTYGQDCGVGGRRSAKLLAETFALPQFGDSSLIPQRVTSLNRQGITAVVVDPIDILNKGMTGIYAVDAWLLAVNPTKARHQSVAWSPDIAKVRRTPRASV
jgi:hypothetical protein